MSDEIVVRTVQAVRKGRGRRPCQINVGLSDDGFVVLRAIEEGGVSPTQSSSVARKRNFPG